MVWLCKAHTTLTMASHISADTLQAYNRLRISLNPIIPAHILDIIAAGSLGALGIAYLFPKWTWDRPDPYEFIYYQRPQSDVSAGSAAQTTRNIAKRLEELVSRFINIHNV